MKHAFVRFAVAAFVWPALGLGLWGAFFVGLVGAAQEGGERVATEAFLVPGGGKIALPGDEVFLLVPKGAVERPVPGWRRCVRKTFPDQ